MRNLILGLVWTVAIALPIPLGAAPIPSEQLEFFEAKVRPILVEHCQSCHGSKKQQGGLRLDSAAGLKAGAEGVPVVVPGKPEKSKLIESVSYTGDYKMPPKGKLPMEAIETLTAWVKMGAPWPDAPVQVAKVEKGNAANHWAFRPVKEPAVPVVRQSNWVASPLDAFILKSLEEKELQPAPAADVRMLARRLSYDLTGLPLDPEEMTRLAQDASPAAIQAFTDRLLASPHFGEKWGRLWLDVARYADTKGYVFQEDRNYPYAYTYRDWVIRAFNEDMPFDRFLMLQIAADRLVDGPDKRDLAAMGFLTVGRRFLNNVADIADDRIDVITRGMMGLTVTCARCHDHKYDPIPTKDYYSLYGVITSSVEPKELPLIGEVERTPQVLAFERELAKLEAEVAAFIKKKHAEIGERLRSPATIATYLLAAWDSYRKPNDFADKLARERDLSKFQLGRWQKFLADNANDPVLLPWTKLAGLPEANWEAQATKKLSELVKADAEVVAALTMASPKNPKDLANAYATILANAKANDAVAKLVRAAPLSLPLEDTEKLFLRDDRNRIQALRKKVDAFKATSPAAPPRAMVLNEGPLINPYVFLRGNPGNRGPSVPRQFLEVLSGPDRKPFTDGSGRVELAKCIASPDNPLTARVFVNRVWAQLFGHGLVRTPSDFGVRCEPPSHPELLDWLARRFVEDRWSVKTLIRRIVQSSTYRQSSQVDPRAAQLDPENRLLSRMNRKRLDFEGLRDGLLAVSGQLDRKVGGKPVDLFKVPFSTRRTVYGFIDRQNLPGTFRVFDFASPDQHSPQRFQTTVPQQALFLLNSPFVAEQTRKLLSRSEVSQASDTPARVTALYRLLFTRIPTSDEIALTTRYLEQVVNDQADVLPNLWKYGVGQYDEKAQRIVKYADLPHFTGTAYQNSAKLPDDKLGWASLTANGGHPGSKHPVVRRFVVPEDGVYAVQGELDHPSKQGDGVRGRIVSSRSGLLGEWVVTGSKQHTEVKRIEAKAGDTIDFIIDCRMNESFDSFVWSSRVRRLDAATGATAEWIAASEFRGPPIVSRMSAWEQYTQVLLLSNEFAFLD